MLGLLGDKKKIVQLVLSERPSHMEEKEVPQGLEGDFSLACEAIGKDIIEAIKSEDPRALAQGLKHLLKLSLKEDEYSEEED